MQERLQLVERGGHIGEMVHHAHHDEGVERAFGEGHLVQIACDEDKAVVVTPIAHCVGQHCPAVVEEHDLVVAEVKIGEAAKSGADFGDAAALRGQEALEGDAFDGILVIASLAFPEVLAVAAAFVVDHRDAGWRGGMGLVIRLFDCCAVCCSQVVCRHAGHSG